MPQRRHTITVASSALFFVCLMLQAQNGLYSQTFTPCSDADAYQVYDSLLPTEWTVAVAHARRLLLQAQTESTAFCPRPSHGFVPLQPLFDSGHSFGNLYGSGTFNALEKKNGLWKKMRWMGTSCAWAS